MSNWTFHRATLYEPHGRVIHFDTYPSGPVKPKKRYYCKYCYTRHRDWYQMRAEDCGGDDYILCGNCGHTSLKELAA